MIFTKAVYIIKKERFFIILSYLLGLEMIKKIWRYSLLLFNQENLSAFLKEYAFVLACAAKMKSLQAILCEK